MIKLNDSDIYVGEIKQLLKDFNLPLCKVYRSDSLLCENSHYIKGNSLYVCKSADGDTTEKYLDCIDTYYGGKYIQNLTSNLRVTNAIYDSYTHKYLGKYLRFLKDFYGINLMSMYNCFCGDTSTNMDYDIGDSEFISDSPDYTIYIVPVRFNENYTIALNCNNRVEVFTALYNNNHIIESDINDALAVDTYDTLRECCLNRPVLYTKLNNVLSDYSEGEKEELLNREELLSLIIKVPKSIDTSIVVLEGDFTKNCLFDLTNGHRLQGKLLRYKATIPDGTGKYDISGIPTWSGEYDYRSKLELLDFSNYRDNYLLSSRICEYLCGNVITSSSEVYDIKKIQKFLIDNEYVVSDYFGTWSDDDRRGIYRFVNDKNINSDYFDVVSYVDKDVEYKLGGLD